MCIFQVEKYYYYLSNIHNYLFLYFSFHFHHRTVKKGLFLTYLNQDPALDL